MSARSVVVLAGGLSVEREVSLRSGERVADALAHAGYEVEVLDVGPEVAGSLVERRPDAVWPVLHGAAGEDGSLAEVLRLLAVPTVGTTPEACRLAWDKSVAAAIVADHDVTVPRAVTLPVGMLRDLGTRRMVPAISEALGPAVVVKPNRGGSSFGLSIVQGADQLPGAMMLAYGHDPVCRIEQFVTGVEVSVTVLDTGYGALALPAVEIEPEDGDYDFQARYTLGATEFHCPARLDRAVVENLRAHAERVHRVLRLGSLSRSDWIVDHDGTAWFLEVNTSPGMTDSSTTPLAMTSVGVPLSRTCADLVRAAVPLAWSSGERTRAGAPSV